MAINLGVFYERNLTLGNSATVKRYTTENFISILFSKIYFGFFHK